VHRSTQLLANPLSDSSEVVPSRELLDRTSNSRIVDGVEAFLQPSLEPGEVGIAAGE
jgi:hypothetical protein